MFDALDGTSERYQLANGIDDVFRFFAESNPDLFKLCLELFLTQDYSYNVFPNAFITKLIENFGRGEARRILSLARTHRQYYLSTFYACLTESEILTEDVASILKLWGESEPSELPQGWNYLLKYTAIEATVFIQVGRVVWDRISANPSFSRCLESLFNPFGQTSKIITSLFSGDIDLLKGLYFAHVQYDRAADHLGSTMSQILNVDSTFLLENIDFVLTKHQWPSSFDDDRDYSFIWLRDDYTKVVRSVVEHLYVAEEKRQFSTGSYLDVFFIIRGKGKYDSLVLERQDAFLKDLIAERNANSLYMNMIFRLISEFENDRRKLFVEAFVKRNPDITAFENIQLESSSRSASGSWVPVHQKRVEYFESLLSILSTFQLLTHKRLIERRIQQIRELIEDEKRRDFTGE
jgi:hypothetical protein